MLESIVFRQDIADRIRIARLECHQCRVHHALVFAGEFFADQSFQFVSVEIENLRDQSENENVFAFVLGRPAERLNREAGNRHADINETFIVQVWLDVIRIVKQDAAFAQKADVVLVTVLVKRDQEIGFVTRRQHFTGTDAHLENGRATGNRGRDGHVRHDIVFAASSESREEGTSSLNAVLRISRKTNHRVLNILRTQISSFAINSWRGSFRGTLKQVTHRNRTLPKMRHHSTGN